MFPRHRMPLAFTNWSHVRLRHLHPLPQLPLRPGLRLARGQSRTHVRFPRDGRNGDQSSVMITSQNNRFAALPLRYVLCFLFLVSAAVAALTALLPWVPTTGPVHLGSWHRHVTRSLFLRKTSTMW